MPPRKEPEPTRQPDPAGATLRNQILANLRGRTTPDASQFVEELSQETQSALVQRITLQTPFNVQDAFLEKSMTTWVDRLFDYFQDFAFEFNPSIRSSELEVTYERPLVTKEVISYNAWREPEKTLMLFKGWLSTRSWTLVTRGTKDKIDVYIVPAERVIGITRTQNRYSPLVQLESTFDKGKVFWRRDGALVQFDDIGDLAKELFTALIKFSRGERNEEEVLVGGTPKGKQVEIPHPLSAGRPASYEEEFFAFASEDTTMPPRMPDPPRAPQASKGKSQTEEKRAASTPVTENASDFFDANVPAGEQPADFGDAGHEPAAAAEPVAPEISNGDEPKVEDTIEKKEQPPASSKRPKTEEVPTEVLSEQEIQRTRQSASGRFKAVKPKANQTASQAISQAAIERQQSTTGERKQSVSAESQRIDTKARVQLDLSELQGIKPEAPEVIPPEAPPEVPPIEPTVERELPPPIPEAPPEPEQQSPPVPEPQPSPPVVQPEPPSGRRGPSPEQIRYARESMERQRKELPPALYPDETSQEAPHAPPPPVSEPVVAPPVVETPPVAEAPTASSAATQENPAVKQPDEGGITVFQAFPGKSNTPSGSPSRSSQSSPTSSTRRPPAPSPKPLPFAGPGPSPKQDILKAQPAAPSPLHPAAEFQSLNSFLSDAASEGDTNVTLACDILLRSVDQEIELATKSGAEAFTTHDFERAQRAMKQTMKLKAFRDKVLGLLSEWKAANTDD
jgi:hypothetical protein